MMSTSRWLIIGLGWLGAPLAERLSKDGVTVVGTHRATFTFGRDPIPRGDFDVVFLNTPPLVDTPVADYVTAIDVPARARVIFISSTSVYGSAEGRVDESTEPRPETASARWLVAVEAALRERFGARLTVIRPSGLIGGDRHPVFPLARRGTVLEDGPVNLIHRDDVIGLIRAVAPRTDVPMLNAVAPHHPLKSTYYGGWAAREGLPAIHTTPGSRGGRVVDSKLAARLYPRWAVPELDRL